ncbi:pyrin and HIN domain-containing protein 1 isoform X4 [Cebus imitator]|uniref:pyrin and HIN domain-containing protein 1 isoform X4 n=1 Tax=Cebus imitator TaxID=2715852 RepID=UPI00189B4BF6|nr:pyrin and HIN domain-containing protein 1 isoform X4 [Cebus imitator]
MANNYKTIVLLKGLEVINDYHFRMVKSLLSSDLKLNPKMRDEYDKIQIADLMEEKFPGDAGLGRLTEIFKEIPTLGNLAETLKKEKLKVKGKTPSKKQQQNEVDPGTPESTPSHTLTAEGAEETPGAQKRKNSSEEETGIKRHKMSKEQTQPPCPAEASMSTARSHSPPPQPSSSTPSNTSSTEAQSLRPLVRRQATARKNICSKDPMMVMVLNATKIFKYESLENERRRMFHATVVTQTEFFHVKVLNINLKRKFTKKRIIIISNYSKYNSLLEVNETSSVFEAGPDQTFQVPKDVIKRARKTPRINILHRQASGDIVYGLFTLHDIWKKTKQRSHDSSSMALWQEQSQLPKPSEAGTTFPFQHNLIKTPQVPPTTPSSSSFTKDTTTQTSDVKLLTNSAPEQRQPQQTAMKDSFPHGCQHRVSQSCAQTSSGSFSYKVEAHLRAQLLSEIHRTNPPTVAGPVSSDTPPTPSSGSLNKVPPFCFHSCTSKT